MGMPIRRFWLFVANIDRISAQKDMRAMNVGSCIQSPEGAKEYRNTLIVELGEIQVVDGRGPGELPAQYYEERDEVGFNELRNLGRGF